MTTEEIKEDLKKEKEFIGQSMGSDSELKFESNLSLLAKVYNEQLEALVRSRIDSDIFSSLVISEPMVKEHLDNKLKADNAVLKRRKIVETLRGQILDFVKETKNDK